MLIHVCAQVTVELSGKNHEQEVLKIKRSFVQNFRDKM